MNKLKYQIIDFVKLDPHTVRFYLGHYDDQWGWTNPNYRNYQGQQEEPSKHYWGDDWNDAPYECNAEKVYEQYIYGYRDISFKESSIILEPADTAGFRLYFSKEDMINGQIPCIIEVPAEIFNEYSTESFILWAAGSKVKRYYFGDEMEPEIFGLD